MTDPDEAAHRVIELGGHVLEPAQNTPHGPVATLADPEGAKFAVVRTEDGTSGGNARTAG